MASKKRTRQRGARSAREREMRRLVREQERIGLSQRVFCQRHGIALSTLTWWRRKLGRGGGKTGRNGRQEKEGFFEVQLVDDTLAAETASTAGSPIEICLPGGTVIRVPHEVPEATLRRVISMVGVPC